MIQVPPITNASVEQAMHIVAAWPIRASSRETVVRYHWQAACDVHYWLSGWSDQESPHRWLSSPNGYLTGRTAYECIDDDPSVIERIASILLGVVSGGYG